MRAIVYPSKISGSQIAPASKSSMQRACAAALLHTGKTIIHNPGYSNDDVAALGVIQKLGAIVETSEILNNNTRQSIVTVTSKGVKPLSLIHISEPTRPY